MGFQADASNPAVEPARTAGESPISYRRALRRLRRWFPRYAVPIAYVAIGTLLLYVLRGSLDRPEAAVCYLLTVVLTATTAGAGPAIIAAVLSFLAWNLFFIGPGFSLSVGQPHDWLTLGVFLIVGMLTGELAGRARERAAEAEARLREISMLHQIGASVAEELDAGKVLPALLDQASRLCGGARAFLIPASGAVMVVQHRPGRGARERPPLDGSEYAVPLEIDGRRVGVLRLGIDPGTITPNDARVLGTLANYAALAIERQRLAEEAATVVGLRAADELKTALLSAVSHGLQTPLASMLASLANLRRRGGSVPCGGVALAAIEGETNRLATLVRDLLDLSRLEAGAWQPAREWNALADLVGSVLGHLDTEDADRIQLALPDDPFCQASGRADAGVSGTGLGLAICRGLVEAHGGRIWVEDRPRGRKVRLHSPAARRKRFD